MPSMVRVERIRVGVAVKLLVVVFSGALCAPHSLAQQPTPLDYAYYAKFPDNGGSGHAPSLDPPGTPSGTHYGLQRFHDLLTRMRKARDDLQSNCVGSRSSNMTARVRGTNVLIFPEQFQECESHASFLRHGDPSFAKGLAAWNKTYGTQYALPKGDPADVQAWERRRSQFAHFPQAGCDAASRAIVLAGTPGFAEPRQKVFEQAKKACPVEWVRLFEPEDDIKKREAAARRRCKPDATYWVVDEKSGNGARETCDASDMYDPSERLSAKAQPAVEADPLAAELAAIGRGEYGKAAPAEGSAEGLGAVLSRRKHSGQGLQETLEQQVRSQPRAGNVGGVELFGGESGRALEAVARGDTTAAAALAGDSGFAHGATAAGEFTSGCDDAAENQAGASIAETRTRSIHALPQHQQRCPMAQLWVDIYARALNYAQRCNRTGAIPSIQKELARSQLIAQQDCNAPMRNSTSSVSNMSTPAIRQAPRPAPPPTPAPPRGPYCNGCPPK